MYTMTTYCPKCGKDFVCHFTDTHLHRQIISADEADEANKADNSKVTDIFICQDCHETEDLGNQVFELIL